MTRQDAKATDQTSAYRRFTAPAGGARLALPMALALLAAVVLAAGALAAAGTTERVSVASDGTQGNNHSDQGSITPDGRYVAFDSAATNLVPNDTNGQRDVFVHDRETGQTERVSVSSSGAQANNLSKNPSISDDGRYVAFESTATNLVADDENARSDVFVHDRETGQTERVSVASDGEEGNGHSQRAQISAEGRHVAFDSQADNLVANDPNGTGASAFVHDRDTAETEIASLSNAGGGASASAPRSPPTGATSRSRPRNPRPAPAPASGTPSATSRTE